MTAGRKAEERYANLVHSIDLVGEQFEPLRKLIGRMKDNPASPGSWRVTPPEELARMLGRSLAALSALKDAAIRYETRLKTREWKV